MKGKDEFKALLLAEHKEKFPNWPDRPARYLGKWSDKKANGLTRMIIKWLQLNGWQAERISVTGRMVDDRKIVTNVIGQSQWVGSSYYLPTNMQKGSADISATIAGQSVKIEIKIGKDKQSHEQMAYQMEIERAGGTYIIAKDFETFVAWYKDFLNKTVHIEADSESKQLKIN